MRIPYAGMTILVLLLAPACFGQGSSPGTSQQSEVPKPQEKGIDFGNITPVLIPFHVTDHHGALIPDLSVGEFEVFEDGRPQKVRFFSAESNLPLTLGYLMDTSGSMLRMLPEERVVATDFLRQVITDKDLAFVISFDRSVDLLQDLTSDIRLLRAGLDRARINVSRGIGGIPGVGQGPVPSSNPKGTVLFDAAYLAAEEILGKQAGRKIMVILTNGMDEGSKLKLKDAMEAVQKADAICYVVLLDDTLHPSNLRDMRQLTEQTGGRVISVNRHDKIGDAFRQISTELRSQYTLAYSSFNYNRDGTFRKIEIKAKNPAYTVRARKGYYAPAN